MCAIAILRLAETKLPRLSFPSPAGHSRTVISKRQRAAIVGRMIPLLGEAARDRGFYISALRRSLVFFEYCGGQPATSALYLFPLRQGRKGRSIIASFDTMSNDRNKRDCAGLGVRPLPTGRRIRGIPKHSA